QLRYTGSRLPAALARLLRWAGGIGGLTALGMLAGGVAVQLWLEYIVQDRQAVLDGTLAGTVSTAAACALWLVVILVTGRSVGDLACSCATPGRDCRPRSPGCCAGRAASADSRLSGCS
ncbi:hypothetical protein CTI14_52700, partial [Methylobacterium radiotolerans]